MADVTHHRIAAVPVLVRYGYHRHRDARRSLCRPCRLIRHGCRRRTRLPASVVTAAAALVRRDRRRRPRPQWLLLLPPSSSAMTAFIVDCICVHDAIDDRRATPSPPWFRASLRHQLRLPPPHSPLWPLDRRPHPLHLSPASASATTLSTAATRVRLGHGLFRRHCPWSTAIVVVTFFCYISFITFVASVYRCTLVRCVRHRRRPLPPQLASLSAPATAGATVIHCRVHRRSSKEQR